MDFQKIKNFFSKKKRPESFHEKTLREKQQKYLFRPDEEEAIIKTRGKKPNILEKTLGKKIKKPQKNHKKSHFSGFFQHSMSVISGERDKKHIMAGVGILLFILIWYIIFLSPYFKISPTKVLIEPMSQWIDTNIVSRSVEEIYGKNIWLIDELSLAKNIKENLKNTEQIRITKLLPNGVKIIVKSLPINYDATIFGVENKRFGISSNGVLIPLTDIKNENFSHHITLISSDLTTELFLWYKKVVTDKNMLVITKILELFDKEWSDLKISHANYFILENELHVTLESNTKIIIALQAEQENPGTDFSPSLLSQLVTLQTYINNNHAKLAEWTVKYLDIRIPWKIFACSDDALCAKNLITVYGKAYE